MKPSQNKKRLHVTFISENRITLRRAEMMLKCCILNSFHTNVNLSPNTTKPPKALNQSSFIKNSLALTQRGKKGSFFNTCQQKKTHNVWFETVWMLKLYEQVKRWQDSWTELTPQLWLVMSVAGGSTGCTDRIDRTDPRNSDLPTYYIAGREKTGVCECTVI